MKTRIHLFAAIGALAAFGTASAGEPAAVAAADVEVIVVTAKRLPAPAGDDLVASARRAVSEEKPEIAVPAVDVHIDRAAEDRG